MKKVILISIVLCLITFLCIKNTTLVKRITFVEPNISKDSLLNLGMPERITNQYIQIRKSAEYVGKSFFIVDTKENLIFLFDNNGNFVAKSPTIDGFNRQVNEGHLKDFALKTYDEKAKILGFKYNYLIFDYVDTTKKNRKLTNTLYFNFIGNTKTNFFPKGKYTISLVSTKKEYLGKNNNLYSIKTMDNKVICKAIHGLYKSEYRIKRMNELKSLIQSDFNNPSVSSKYRNKIIKNLDNNYYNNSFGCINVPEKFLELSSDYALYSLVFVLGENQNDYLVK